RNEHQISILFSSHNLHQVQLVCDRVGIFVEGKLLAEGDIETLSKELFTHGMYLIELGIEKSSLPQGTDHNELWLKKMLEPVNGIEKIVKSDGHFQIECASDLTSDISKQIIASGLGLNYLTRKEYGLDAIYNRYFEGGINHD
ncbi:MAG: ABC transporter ATP-binding protein, partial [Draconibacterium sp.]|nr:ABC transporter ATP-binding protein [Draconibacterium sp.]